MKEVQTPVSAEIRSSRLLPQWRNRASELKRPFQASLELTHRCNERCTHCYIPEFKDDPKRILTLNQWEHILGELRQAGVFYLIFMGGEAMLNPLFWEIAGKARSLGFYLSMITNGLKINAENSVRLTEVGFSCITFSLYSLNSEIHDKMTRVRGSQVRTMAAIELCSRLSLRVDVNCLLTKNNIEGYFELRDWCEQRGFAVRNDVTVTPKLNHDLGPTYLRATPEQLKWYYSKLIEKSSSSIGPVDTEKREDYICNAAKGKCAVTPYGDLLPCIEIREPLGNLLNHSFEEIWNGEVANRWRNLKVSHLRDRNPEHSQIHNHCEHCPGMAKHETNDPLKISPFFVELAQIKKSVFEPIFTPPGSEQLN